MKGLLWGILCLCLWASPFVSHSAEQAPQDSSNLQSAHDISKDEDFLILESKRIAGEIWKGNADLENRGVKVYARDKYIVVQFYTIPPKGFLVAGGDTSFYFVRKPSGGYEFIKVLCGQ